MFFAVRRKICAGLSLRTFLFNLQHYLQSCTNNLFTENRSIPTRNEIFRNFFLYIYSIWVEWSPTIVLADVCLQGVWLLSLLLLWPLAIIQKHYYRQRARQGQARTKNTRGKTRQYCYYYKRNYYITCITIKKGKITSQDMDKIY